MQTGEHSFKYMYATDMERKIVNRIRDLFQFKPATNRYEKVSLFVNFATKFLQES